MVNSILVGLLDSVLGKGSPTARGNYAYKCPFCEHHKKKLEYNTQIGKYKKSKRYSEYYESGNSFYNILFHH